MLRIREIKLALNESQECLPKKIEKKLHLPTGSVLSWTIRRESVDARKKPQIWRIYTVDFTTSNEAELQKRFRFLEEVVSRQGKRIPRSERPRRGVEKRGEEPPVIVGFGPCGMFAGLYLARQGLCPVILERGKPMEERIRDVADFWKTGQLQPKSNVQFGEGGAGTFSDGKLYSGIKRSEWTEIVLQELVDHGAPADILYKPNPHIGTDLLRKVVVAIRREIEELGGTVAFETQCVGLEIEKDQLVGVRTDQEKKWRTQSLVLALGHSARDTFQMLWESGVRMQPKAFSIGARIEHLQSQINQSQYGRKEAADMLGPAEYRLSTRCRNGRGVYTFCMCPGGYVVGAASEVGGVVTNGMSYHDRGGRNANSAVLVSVEPSDFESEHPLAGVAFQRKWEQAAFAAGGGGYWAPAQTVGDFLRGVTSVEPGSVMPTVRPGVRWTDLATCLPNFAAESLREAIPQFGKKVQGFDAPDAVLTGVETRSSSPVRILRDEEKESNIRGIYPAGEGAGYAGGILSAAVDGIRVAEKVHEKYRIDKNG